VSPRRIAGNAGAELGLAGDAGTLGTVDGAEEAGGDADAITGLLAGLLAGLFEGLLGGLPGGSAAAVVAGAAAAAGADPALVSPLAAEAIGAVVGDVALGEVGNAYEALASGGEVLAGAAGFATGGVTVFRLSRPVAALEGAAGPAVLDVPPPAALDAVGALEVAEGAVAIGKVDGAAAAVTAGGIAGAAEAVEDAGGVAVL
jgi:hypothetical protein